MRPLPVVAVEDPWVRWDWVSGHVDEIGLRLQEHVELTALTMAIGLVIALPLGVACYRFGRLYPAVLAVAGIIYSIPSLALFAFLIPYTGLSRATTLIPLVSYTLLILVRNVVAGFQGVSPEIVESAEGMGYSSTGVLFRVQLPLAMPAVMAGIRITAVTTIGLVTIASLIGEGGLGRFIVDGINRDFKTPLVVGTVLAVGLAILVDTALALTERLLSPWSRKRS